MNKITHEGNDYEVLSLDRISEITHAKLAGGVVPVERHKGKQYIVWTYPDTDKEDTAWIDRLEFIGIQPLKLLEKVPVEFTGIVFFSGDDYIICAPKECRGKTFRCVEVVEVTK